MALPKESLNEFYNINPVHIEDHRKKKKGSVWERVRSKVINKWDKLKSDFDLRTFELEEGAPFPEDLFQKPKIVSFLSPNLAEDSLIFNRADWTSKLSKEEITNIRWTRIKEFPNRVKEKTGDLIEKIKERRRSDSGGDESLVDSGGGSGGGKGGLNSGCIMRLALVGTAFALASAAFFVCERVKEGDITPPPTATEIPSVPLTATATPSPSSTAEAGQPSGQLETSQLNLTEPAKAENFYSPGVNNSKNLNIPLPVSNPALWERKTFESFNPSNPSTMYAESRWLEEGYKALAHIYYGVPGYTPGVESEDKRDFVNRYNNNRRFNMALIDNLVDKVKEANPNVPVDENNPDRLFHTDKKECQYIREQGSNRYKLADGCQKVSYFVPSSQLTRQIFEEAERSYLNSHSFLVEQEVLKSMQEKGVKIAPYIFEDSDPTFSDYSSVIGRGQYFLWEYYKGKNLLKGNSPYIHLPFDYLNGDQTALLFEAIKQDPDYIDRMLTWLETIKFLNQSKVNLKASQNEPVFDHQKGLVRHRYADGRYIPWVEPLTVEDKVKALTLVNKELRQKYTQQQLKDLKLIPS